MTKFDGYPGREEFAVEVDHYCVVDGKYSYFDLPYSPSLFPGGADTRTLPLFIAGESRWTVNTSIDLPPNFHNVAIAPEPEKLEAPDGAGLVRITSIESEGKRVITHEMQTAPAIVPAGDYPALLRLEANLGRQASKTMLIESTAAPVP